MDLLKNHTTEETQELYDYLMQNPLAKALAHANSVFEAEKERLAGDDYPYADKAFSKALSEMMSVQQDMVLELMKHPKINENRALIDFFRSLKYSIEYHIDQVQNCESSEPAAPGV